MRQQPSTSQRTPLLDPTLLGVEVSTAATTGIVVRLTGELDLVTASRLDAILERLRGDGHRQITLDLSRLDLLTAAGLRVFARVDHELRAAGGGRLSLADPSPLARRVLNITAFMALVTEAGSAAAVCVPAGSPGTLLDGPTPLDAGDGDPCLAAGGA